MCIRDSFKTQQTKSLELFERFLNEQNQQSQQLLNMISQQIGPVQNVLNNTPPSIDHTNGTGNGNSYANGNGHAAIDASKTPTFPPIVEEKVAVGSMQLAADSPQTAIPTTDKQQPTTGIDKSKIEGILLTVISEKTGYPAEMLELSMDMEADLGIDSIIRVEIFGAMTEDYPEVSGINPNDLTELRTLGQIVDYISQTGKKKTLTEA